MDISRIASKRATTNRLFPWLAQKPMAEVSGRTTPLCCQWMTHQWFLLSFSFVFYFLAKSFTLYSLPTTHQTLYSVMHSLPVSIILSTTFDVHLPTVNLGLSCAHLLPPNSPSYSFQMFQTQTIQALRHFKKEIEEIMFLHGFTWFHLCSFDTVVHFLPF